ncbi:hypothetical protein N2152v2_004219 [Parachlorella kessleri]
MVPPHTSIRRDAKDVTQFIKGRDVHPPGYLSSLSPIHTSPRTVPEQLAYAWLLVVRVFVWAVCTPKAWSGAGGKGGARRGPSEASLARRLMLFSSDAQATAMSGMIMNHFRVYLTGRSDNGWIHALAMEVECGRAQWLIWQEAIQSSFLSRFLDLLVLGNLLSQCLIVYLLGPSVVHAYQVYRAEDVIWWQTYILKLLDTPGALPAWEGSRAPKAATAYYSLEEGASLRDALLRMRADEVSIRHINLQLMKLSPGSRTSAILAAGEG